MPKRKKLTGECCQKNSKCTRGFRHSGKCSLKKKGSDDEGDSENENMDDSTNFEDSEDNAGGSADENEDEDDGPYEVTDKAANAGQHMVYEHPFIFGCPAPNQTLAPSTPALTRERCLFSVEWMKQAFNIRFFEHPVDWKAMGLFTYPEIVKEPMDLQTLTVYIQSENFTFDGFLYKARLIWKNACLFNPVSNIFHEIALHLHSLFENKIAEMQQHPDDDDPTRLRLTFISLLMCFQAHDLANVFLKPIDFDQCTHYSNCVTLPLCINQVTDNLLDNKYYNRHDIASDMERVFHNGIVYNGPSSSIGVKATHLKDLNKRLFDARFGDVDKKHIVTTEMRQNLSKNLNSISESDRYEALTKMRNICPDAVEDYNGKSKATIDMLNLTQFLTIDMFARQCYVKMNIVE